MKDEVTVNGNVLTNGKAKVNGHSSGPDSIMENFTKTEFLDEKETSEIVAEFNAAWPRLLQELLEDELLVEIRDSMLWLDHVLRENVPLGKKNRALVGIFVYFHLAKDRVLSEEEKYLCYISGWCAEIMQTAALIADDMMDGSVERRGRMCWYKHDNVGVSAINDALLLENVCYHIMWKYYSGQDYFVRLLRVIMDTGFRTVLGQSLDTRLSFEVDLSKFTVENYKAMVKYKTSYYSFYTPVAVAMIRAGLTDPHLFKKAEDLAVNMGYLFQVQDDFLDCYGETELTGKVGTDIQDRKCTWLIVTALEAASEEQKLCLQELYGCKDEESVNTVEEMFEELNIEKKYRLHEDRVYKEICQQINTLPPEIPMDPLTALLNSIYKRNK